MAHVHKQVRNDKSKEADQCRRQVDTLRRTWVELKLDVERKAVRETEPQRMCQFYQTQIAVHEQHTAMTAQQLDALHTQHEDMQQQLANPNMYFNICYCVY